VQQTVPLFDQPRATIGPRGPLLRADEVWTDQTISWSSKGATNGSPLISCITCNLFGTRHKTARSWAPPSLLA
jgi:hypothetical protein